MIDLAAVNRFLEEIGKGHMSPENQAAYRDLKKIVKEWKELKGDKKCSERE